MTLISRTQALIAIAHGHLEAAAATAERTSTDAITRSAFAAQIRLAAATLPEIDVNESCGPLPEADVATHLRDALAALDDIPPLDGPGALPLCGWHVHELLRIATRPGAA